jgi:FkbM family methyltransferase
MKIFNKRTSPKDQINDGYIPASIGESMEPFIKWLGDYSTLKPSNVFEIGANLAQDAEFLRKGFGLSPKDVWVFEPHPDLFKIIQKSYKFKSYDYAVLDKDAEIVINAIDPKKNSNSGISSVRKHNDVPSNHFRPVKVKAIRMDTFIKKYQVESIDFLKLDVEGCNFEVLEGFGKELDIIKSMHIEAEHHEHWAGERLWEDIRTKLEPHFEMVFFERHFTQSDSFWIKKELIKNNI